jgi:hypothetical protein
MELLYDDLSKKELYLIQQSKVPTWGSRLFQGPGQESSMSHVTTWYILENLQRTTTSHLWKIKDAIALYSLI